jgi:hypothetical protein
VGFKFTLVLSREITDDESATLRDGGCSEAVFGPDSLPTNADVPVTKMDFDDTISPSLAEAIESALEAVKQVPELSVPGLTVPAQPATREDAEKTGGDSETQGVVAGEKPEVLAEERVDVVAEEKPAAKKPAAKKPSARKPAAKKSAAKQANGAEEHVGTAAGSA